MLAVVPFGPAYPIVTPIIDQPDKVSLTDLDHDGQLDLLVQQTLAPSGNAFSQRQHVLTSYRKTDFGYEPSTIATGIEDHVVQDFNADGREDLLVRNARTAYLLVNEADGTLTPVSLPAFRDANASNRFFRVDSIGVADMDLDGDIDITVVASDRPGTRGSNFAWLENDGNGGFGDLNRELPMFGSSAIATAGDFDGDGDVDLIANRADVGSRGFAWFQNTGDVYHMRALPASNLGRGGSIRVRDVTGDGIVDAIVVEGGSKFSQNDENVFVYRYDAATDHLVSDPDFAFGLGASNLVFHDTDRDGDLDAIRHTERFVDHFERTPTGFLPGESILTTKGDIAGLAVGATGPDAKAGLVTAQRVPDRLEITTGAFAADAQSSVIAANIIDGVVNVRVADFNGDGFNDLLLPGTSLDWLPGPITHQARTSVNGIADLPAKVAEVVDVDRDGDPDILTSTESELIWFENDQATFARHVLGPAVAGLALMDLDNDGQLDLITSDGMSMQLMRYEFQADTNSFSPVSVAIDLTGIQLATPPGLPNPFAGTVAGDAFVADLAADFAEDSRNRLALTYCEDGCEARGLLVVEWMTEQTASYQLLSRINDDDVSISMTFGDFDGDTRSELLSEYGDESATVLLYSFLGDGTVEVSEAYRCGECELSRPTVVDLDLDGDLDVWHASRQLWLDNQGGEPIRFLGRLAPMAGLERGSILTVAELDGLPFPELIVASGNLLQVIYNEAAELDFNSNGTFDVGDLDVLGAAIVRRDTDAKYDIDRSGTVEHRDMSVALHGRAGARIGDVNLDSVVDSSDLVMLFRAGKFERDVDAFWSEGDFDLDGRFTSSDLVALLSTYLDDD